MAEENVVSFVLRLSPRTHRRIKKAAAANNTSMNREIANVLDARLDEGSLSHRVNKILAILQPPTKKRVIS